MDHLSKLARVTKPITQDQPYPGSGAMLIIIQNKWVTTKYNEQILEAMTADEHRTHFLAKYYKYNQLNDTMYDSINWQAIGDARRGIQPHRNIRLFKYMNGWLNSGRQQGLFGELPYCPSCGDDEETQLHMFQCNHPTAKETRKLAFKDMAQYYHKHSIPSLVYMPFIAMCKEACTSQPTTVVSSQLDIIHRAIDKQRSLGKDFLLRGYLVTAWKDAIAFYQHDKPEVCLRHLYRGLWEKLFEPVWATRNTIKHGDDSYISRTERENFIKTLRDWKMNAGTRLGANQQYLVDFSYDDITTWPTQHFIGESLYYRRHRRILYRA